MRDGFWILNGRVPEYCTDLLRWGRWFETADRIIARTELMDGDVVVSTIFLGVDHRFLGDGPPILFETMIFGEKYLSQIFGREMEVREDMGQWRYCTYDEAERGHAAHVSEVTAQIERAKKLTQEALKKTETDKQ